MFPEPTRPKLHLDWFSRFCTAHGRESSDDGGTGSGSKKGKGKKYIYIAPLL